MCGKDGTQRGVYKLKEEHEEGEVEKHRQKGRERSREKRIALITRENDRCTNFRP